MEGISATSVARVGEVRCKNVRCRGKEACGCLKQGPTNAVRIISIWREASEAALAALLFPCQTLVSWVRWEIEVEKRGWFAGQSGTWLINVG